MRSTLCRCARAWLMTVLLCRSPSRASNSAAATNQATKATARNRTKGMPKPMTRRASSVFKRPFMINSGGSQKLVPFRPRQQDHGDPFQKSERIIGDRFGDVFDASSRPGLFDVAGESMSGHGNDGNVRLAGIGFQVPQQAQAV